MFGGFAVLLALALLAAVAWAIGFKVTDVDIATFVVFVILVLVILVIIYIRSRTGRRRTPEV